jgi:hypothetical protein
LADFGATHYPVRGANPGRGFVEEYYAALKNGTPQTYRRPQFNFVVSNDGFERDASYLGDMPLIRGNERIWRWKNRDVLIFVPEKNPYGGKPFLVGIYVAKSGTALASRGNGRSSQPIRTYTKHNEAFHGDFSGRNVTKHSEPYRGSKTGANGQTIRAPEKTSNGQAYSRIQERTEQRVSSLPQSQTDQTPRCLIDEWNGEYETVEPMPDPYKQQPSQKKRR